MDTVKYGLLEIGVKGDVSILEDVDGNIHHQVLRMHPFKIKSNCEKSFIGWDTIDGIDIKYDRTGKKGFCVYKDYTCYGDNIWVYEEASTIAQLVNAAIRIFRLRVGYIDPVKHKEGLDKFIRKYIKDKKSVILNMK